VVLYSWDKDPKKTDYTVRLRKDRIERLRGLPGDGYAISLDEKS
jgi:hypothetical protein